MNITIGLALGIFLLLWIWIAFEIKNAPEINDNFDISEKDINDDLSCMYGKDEDE
jgi:hypothetical protein